MKNYFTAYLFCCILSKDIFECSVLLQNQQVLRLSTTKELNRLDKN